MSSPSSLLLPENGDDWPIRILVLVTPCAWATPPASKHSAPTAAVNARIVVIAPPPRSRKIGRCEDSPYDDSTPQKGEPKPSPSLLSEEFLDLIHPRLGAGVVSIAVPLADHLELAQQFPLSLGQVYRRLDDDVAKQIAVFPTAHAANALSAQPKYLPRLSLGGDSDPRRTVQRGNFDLSTERCRRETDRHLAVQVVVVALKNRMGLDLDLHVKITCRSATDPGLALARKANAIAVVYAGGNLDRERFLFFHSRGTVAGRAGLGDDLSSSLALRARLLDGEKPLLHAYLTVPFTGRAGSR